MSVVRSIVRAGGSELEAAPASALNSRIQAFADGLEAGATATDLWEMLARQIMLSGAQPGERVRLEGPEVRVLASDAALVSLALHELLTNAFQHGALARPGGTVDISWTLVEEDGGRWVCIEWREDALAALSSEEPAPGFGLDLLQHGLPEMIGASVRVEFLPRGLFTSLKLRLDDRAALA